MNRHLLIASTSLVLLLVLLFTTDPSRVPSIILFLPFILLFVCLMTIILYLLGMKGITGRKGVKVAGLCAGVPLALLVLQSIGQLTLRDVLVITALFVVSYFYLLRSPATS
jgi:hypothetical protein